MRIRFVLLLGVAAFSGSIALAPAPGLAANCAQGSADEQIACLGHALTDLEAKVDALTKQMEAANKDALKWNDRIALMNEDMRLFPRCLDNPGPNSTTLTDVFANSCAKVPAQAWMIVKPYQ
jgi:outer membrane murein-binding lipoprotein Lpp